MAWSVNAASRSLRRACDMPRCLLMRTPSPQRGEGWGEGVPTERPAPLTPPSPQRGEGEVRCSIIFQQPLDVIELLLRAGEVAKTLAQFLDDTASALHVDVAGNFDRRVVAVFAPAQRPAERIGVLLGARRAEPSVAAGTALSHLLLHRLRQTLRALAQRVERFALRVDGIVGIALAEIARGVAHRFAGAAELVHLVLARSARPFRPLRVVAETVVFQIIEQFAEPVAQGLLALLQPAH